MPEPENDRWRQDAEDVRLAREGVDPEAFGRLVERYGGMLAALAYERMGSVADAQDAVQETFAQAYARLSLLREPERFAGWAHGILRAVTAMRLRRRGVERRHLARLAEEAPPPRHAFTPLDRMIAGERDRQLRAAVAALSEPLREAIAVRYLSGAGRGEGAALLGLSQDAFDKRLERALRELRRRLSENSPDEAR